MGMSGDGPAAGAASRSPLADPGFQQNLLHALENLRKLIVAVEEPLRVDAPRLAPGVPPKSAPGSNSAPQKVTRRDSRILRRLESQLAQALPATGSGRRPGTATTSSSLSSFTSTSTST